MFDVNPQIDCITCLDDTLLKGFIIL